MKKLMLVAILAGGMLTLSTLIFAGEIQIGTVQNAEEKRFLYMLIMLIVTVSKFI